MSSRTDRRTRHDDRRQTAGHSDGTWWCWTANRHQQFHRLISDLSDEVAMQIHRGDAIGVDHLGVGILPIFARCDGAVHQGFNLAHGCVLVELKSL